MTPTGSSSSGSGTSRSVSTISPWVVPVEGTIAPIVAILVAFKLILWCRRVLTRAQPSDTTTAVSEHMVQTVQVGNLGIDRLSGNCGKDKKYLVEYSSTEHVYYKATLRKRNNLLEPPD